MPPGRRNAFDSHLILDVALAAALSAVGVAEVAFRFRDGGLGQRLSGPAVPELAVVAALTWPLAWRRRRPLPALMVVAFAMAAQVLFLSPSAPFLIGLLPLLVLTFDVARRTNRDAAAGLAVAVGALAVTSVEVPAMHPPGEIIFTGGIIAGIWLAGHYAGRRQRRADQVMTYAARLEADHDQRAREAIAAERSRIAGELHDIVAHCVSVMGIQAGAARAMLDSDPERARGALQVIEATAREAIGELRRLLELLRDDADTTALQPQPGLADLERLVGQVRQSGLNVDVRIEGDARPLSPGLDLAAYRIVQEALTNAVKHAGPANADVRIRFTVTPSTWK